jgi:hypothetical protein
MLFFCLRPLASLILNLGGATLFYFNLKPSLAVPSAFTDWFGDLRLPMLLEYLKAALGLTVVHYYDFWLLQC